MEGMKGDHKKIHCRKYGCLVTRGGYCGGFSLQQALSQGGIYAGTIGYRSREVLKGELVKKAMKMREGAGLC